MAEGRDTLCCQTMTQPEQINALANELQAVVNRYRREFDLPLASVIGTLEHVKLWTWLQEVTPHLPPPLTDPLTLCLTHPAKIYPFAKP